MGTRPAIHAVTYKAAEKARQFFSMKWVGGTLTNKERILRKSVGFDPDKVSQVIKSMNTAAGKDDEEIDSAALTATQPKVALPG